MKILCRKCRKAILTDRQHYKHIGKPTYRDGEYTYKEYEHIDCNAKNMKVIKPFTTKQIIKLNKILGGEF